MIGRENERARLAALVASKKSEFMAIYGRRRVGKTFLVRTFFDNKFDFYMTGLSNAATAKQLAHFKVAYHNYCSTESQDIPENWYIAFNKLINHFGSLPPKKTGKYVIFIDELPWLATPKSDFLTGLEYFWNSWASARRDILLIACGSAASWMIKKLINNTGGLYNRVTARFKLLPFNLYEVERFFRSKEINLDRYQIVQLYMITGGIPFYLEEVKSGMSAAQNIEEICFKPGALLRSEFPQLLFSLFKKARKHQRAIAVLAEKPFGLTRNQIVQKMEITTGGGLTRVLFELEESGFICKYYPYGKNVKGALYRISDFYTLFYYKYIKNSGQYEPGVWTNAIDLPSVRAWSGLAFEQVVLAHIPQVKQALRIGGIMSKTYIWSTAKKSHTQLDLIIERRDKVINLCEIKFSISPFTITKDYANKLRNKIAALKEQVVVSKSIFLTMITTYGIKNRQYAGSLVPVSVEMDALFEPLPE